MTPAPDPARWRGRRVLLIEHPRNSAAAAGLRTILDSGCDVRLVAENPSAYGPLVQRCAGSAGSLEICRADTRRPSTVQAAARRAHADAVLSFSHHFTSLAARLAALSGLTGPSEDSVGNGLFKDRTRALLGTASTNVDHVVVRTTADVRAAVDALGGDVVVKPLSETSSLGVVRARGHDEALAAFRELAGHRVNRQGQALDGRVLMERHVEGEEFSVETLSTPAGVQVYGVTAKRPHAVNPFVEQADTFPCEPPDRAVVDAAVSAVRGLGEFLGPAHTEVRLSADGPRIMEVNPRQGGGQLPRMIEATTGRNVFVDAVAVAFRESPVLPPTPPASPTSTWWQCYAPRAGRLIRVDGIDAVRSAPGVVHAEVRKSPGDAVGAAASNLDCIADIIATGPAAADGVALARSAAALLTIEVQDRKNF